MSSRLWHKLQVGLRLAPGQRSLRRHLMVWLLLPQLVLWMAAAYVTYHLAARYANRAIDRSLYQSSRALAQQVKPIGNGLFIDFPKAAQSIIETDPDDKVYYMVSTPPGQFILGNNKLPPPPEIAHPQLDLPYFYDGSVGDTPVRVAALYLAWGEEGEPQRMLVQIAKSRTTREDLARQILIDTALPLSGLIVLMSLIVWGGIRTGLAPLTRLRDLVEDRAPNDLAPIKLESAPTEVRALAKALNTLLAEVHENVSSQKRFISNAAHQLRTPLAGLKSQAELAHAEASDPVLKARLQRVQESAARAAHLVAQLLTLARAEPESAAVQARSRFDLQKLARDLAAELVPRALQAGVDLGCDDDSNPGPLEVSGNALLIREALQNLIDNAIRYAGRGATVTLRSRRDRQQAVIEVEDDGPGLPPEPQIHERVFERFVRATHEGNGCGLGLAIVKEIAERHAGKVALSPVLPHGLRATLRLPLAG
ncbi:sensor histidine kinase [Aquabacterium sp. A7-Y]|uniref:sensor histidine kinase n=1 Tax=Aquabacterium sp. A7-Y TaxID=1349605 RepID=UPI00223DA007|nr:sensor histidine kinase [Aquabacterium sp. A7-Y]MCW7541834.1 sensor histidine kinase [Aquabacterium sp. A7-Y]